MVNMRSQLGIEDLSTRARIRHAAILRFARDGFEVSLRTIGGDAGVSAAAILKHFGSKDGLRAACDDYVFETIREGKRAVVATKHDAPGAFIAQFARISEYRPLVIYVLRTYQAGGETARAFIDHMAGDALEYVQEGVEAGTIVPSRDEEARVRFLLGATFGNLLLELLSTSGVEALESDEFWERGLHRISLSGLEIYSEGFLMDRTLLDTYLLYIADPPADDTGH